MSRTERLKIGDLVVERKTKKSFIVLRRENYYTRTMYGKTTGTRKRFLVMSPTGRQSWKVDTAMKVEFFLPGDPYFDDIR